MNYYKTVKVYETGRFFIKEMELKRKYKEEGGKKVQTDWYERNIHLLDYIFI